MRNANAQGAVRVTGTRQARAAADRTTRRVRQTAQPAHRAIAFCRRPRVQSVAAISALDFIRAARLHRRAARLAGSGDTRRAVATAGVSGIAGNGESTAGQSAARN
jgi:hypothetical protein